MPRYATVIHWFRRDLRLSDNAALAAAAAAGATVVPVYVRSEWGGKHAWTGPGRQAFLCGCLESLAKNIAPIGGGLVCRSGDAVEEIEKLVRETRAEAVFFNRDPDPHGRAVERKVRELCRAFGIACHDHQDAVLHEAGEVAVELGEAFSQLDAAARGAGVEAICHGTAIDRGGVTLGAALPVDQAPQRPEV